MDETISQYDNHDIPLFLLKHVNVELEVNKSQNEVDFSEGEYSEIDELFESIDESDLSHTNVEPIGVEWILPPNYETSFAPTYVASITRRELAFGIHDDGNLVSLSDNEIQICTPPSPKNRILYISWPPGWPQTLP